MIGAFDITFCSNRGCSKSNSCGRAIKRLDGQKAIVSIAFFRPEGEECKHEMPYREYQVPEWMVKLAEEHEERYNAERSRRQELADADSLDADDLDREV